MSQSALFALVLAVGLAAIVLIAVKLASRFNGRRSGSSSSTYDPSSFILFTGSTGSGSGADCSPGDGGGSAGCDGGGGGS
jgi:hypothetical protein